MEINIFNSLRCQSTKGNACMMDIMSNFASGKRQRLMLYGIARIDSYSLTAVNLIESLT